MSFKREFSRLDGCPVEDVSAVVTKRCLARPLHGVGALLFRIGPTIFESEVALMDLVFAERRHQVAIPRLREEAYGYYQNLPLWRRLFVIRLSFRRVERVILSIRSH